MLPLVWINGVVSFLSWSEFICNFKMANTRKRVHNDYYLFSKVNTLNKRVDMLVNTFLLQEQIPRFPHGWLIYMDHLYTPIRIRWIIGGRVHQKSSTRKVTHLSIIPA